ncbi:hypothetical protein [Actinoallomurus sp. NPDC050550]|uniref:hypothetical protein n=1 Tax=Actinoallomurus sp. NPDC050550 TaxID=3154937 RepID=UPI0033C861D7
MESYTTEDIYAYAKWLTQECQAAELRAEQYGAEIFIHRASNHLSERIICRPDEENHLRWHWSWGIPIGRLNDSARLLAVDDIEELIRVISKVVCVPLRRGE